MASKQTPTDAPAATDAPAPDAPQSDAPVAPAFTWDALPEPMAMPNKVAATNLGANVIERIPAPIRERAELSLTTNAARVAAANTSNAKRPRADYHWDVQRVPTAELGAEFVKLITKYAKYRPTPNGIHTPDCGLQGSGLDKKCTCPATIPFAGAKSPAGQVTARCGEPQHYVTAADGKPEACSATTEGAYIGVRYSVRPFQARADSARLPGTA